MRDILNTAVRVLRPPSWATLVVAAPYAIFCLAAASAYASAWFASLAAYYITLCCIRVYLLNCFRRAAGKAADWKVERCRRCAWVLIVLCVPLAGIIILAASTGSAFSYPGPMVYAFGAYAFAATAAATVGLVGSRKRRCPIRIAWSVVSMGSALVSVFALQTALISRFSAEGEAYRTAMNAATGMGILVIIGTAAIAMLLWATRKAVGKGSALEQV